MCQGMVASSRLAEQISAQKNIPLVIMMVNYDSNNSYALVIYH